MMTRHLTALAFILVALAAGYANLQAWQSAQDNKALTCATARLVSFVPALQFEGEPRKNFLGWVESRHDMLVEIQRREACGPETQRLLENRVKLDREVLQQSAP